MKAVDLNHMVSMVDIYNTVLTLLDITPAEGIEKQAFALTPQRRFVTVVIYLHNRKVSMAEVHSRKGIPSLPNTFT